jgi:hypothetical protein
MLRRARRALSRQPANTATPIRTLDAGRTLTGEARDFAKVGAGETVHRTAVRN